MAEGRSCPNRKGGFVIVGARHCCRSTLLLMLRTPECNGCLTCVSVCPVKDALDMRTLRRRRRLAARPIAFGVSLVFLLVVGYAKNV